MRISSKCGLVSVEGGRRLDLSGHPYSFHIVREDRENLKIVEQIIIVDDTKDLAERLGKALMKLNRPLRKARK